MRSRKKERGGATPPSSSLGLFGAGGANRGELRDHVPLPLKERGVDRQLTRTDPAWNATTFKIFSRENEMLPDSRIISK